MLADRAGRLAPRGVPAGLDALGERARALLPPARRARLTDVLLVVAASAQALGDFRYGDTPGRSGWTLLLGLLLPLPLLWRRSRPLAVFLTMAAIGLVEFAAGVIANGGHLPVLLALYAVGAHSASRRDVAVAAVVAQVGVVMAALRFAPAGQVLIAVLLVSGTVLAAWVLGSYVRTRRAYVQSVLERARTAERDRDQRALLAAAEERTRIAREMHDIVAHSISVMIALSDGVAATVTRDPATAHSASQQVSATGRQALTEMQRLLGVLRDRDEAELAPQPGLAQLDELLVPLRAAGLQVRLVEHGVPADLPPSAQLAVYRLVQESLTNVLKHGSGVTSVTVALHHSPGGVDVSVEDDGAPVGPAARSTRDGGHGLAGMRERLEAFSGTLLAGPRDGAGWRVHGHLVVEPQTDGTLRA